MSAFMKNKKHIFFCSGGKDSIANVLLALRNNIKVDEIVFVEVMFNENISGEIPEHIDFVKNKLKPYFENRGLNFTILRSDKTYMDCFNHVVTKTKKTERYGMRAGFPMAGKCAINRDCKMKPIKEYLKNQNDYIEYVGIAVDEPLRLERLHKKVDKVSLLEKFDFTEKMAYELCKEFDLLSPIYETNFRGGCWFCPNAKKSELINLYFNNRNLFDKIVRLEKEKNIIGDKFNILKNFSIIDLKDELETQARINLYSEVEE